RGPEWLESIFALRPISTAAISRSFRLMGKVDSAFLCAAGQVMDATMRRYVLLILGVLLLSCSKAPAASTPLEIPFDFSHGELAISVMVKGHALHMLLDTGVDPSVIDLARARALGLQLGQEEGGGVSGTGSGQGSAVYPVTLGGLAIG